MFQLRKTNFYQNMITFLHFYYSLGLNEMMDIKQS